MTAELSLQELIYSSSVQAFEDWRKEFPQECIFAFALSTIDDAIYVNASLNSEESHKRTLAERKLDPQSGEALDAKWGPWEWEHEFTGQAHFAVVDDRLQRMYDQMHEESFPEFREEVLDAMLQALVLLRQNNVIANHNDSQDIVLFATIYDSFEAEELHRISAELLNSPESVQELLAVIGG